MRVLDLFAGTGSATQPFEDAGHEVIKVEMNEQFDADLHADISLTSPTDLRQLGTGGDYDFVWASPPCTAFSVASIGHHWTGGHRAYVPKTEFARYSINLVWHTLRLINAATKHDGHYVIENPRGVLRKLGPVQGLDRSTVWYCQYGDARAKPTDLWHNLPITWQALACKNGNPDHEPAPRGAKTGTQGLSKTERSMVPYALGKSILDVLGGGGERF